MKPEAMWKDLCEETQKQGSRLLEASREVWARGFTTAFGRSQPFRPFDHGLPVSGLWGCILLLSETPSLQTLLQRPQ